MIKGNIITLNNLDEYNVILQGIIENINQKLYIGTVAQYEADKTQIPIGAVVVLTDKED